MNIRGLAILARSHSLGQPKSAIEAAQGGKTALDGNGQNAVGGVD